MKTWQMLMVLGSALALTAGSAQADLTLKDKNGKVVDSVSASCGGDSFTGKELQYTVTDPAGDIFTMLCEDRTEFIGTVLVKATGKETPFGRCVFVAGANIIKYEVDAKNNYKAIDWVNVKPMGNNAADRATSRNKIISDLATNMNETTDDWLKRVAKYFKDNNLEGNANNRIYMFPFSPNDQAIDVFKNDTLTTDYILTPSEADMDYLPHGGSPLSDLVIDPSMKTSLTDLQYLQTTVVPEPSSLALLVSMGLGGAALLARRRKTAGRAD